MTALPTNWTAVLDRVAEALVRAEGQAAKREAALMALAAAESTLASTPRVPSLEPLDTMLARAEQTVVAADSRLAEVETALAEWRAQARTCTENLADLRIGSL